MASRMTARTRWSCAASRATADEPIESRSLNPHCPLTWDEIYRDWQHDDLKYYWKDLPLKLSPWDDGYLTPKRRIC